MKKRELFRLAFLAVASLWMPAVMAQDLVIQPQSIDGKSYLPIRWGEVSEVKVSEDGETGSMTVMLKEGDSKSFNFDNTTITSGYTIPLITITTDEELEQIPDKINYKTATIKIDGFGSYDDVETEVSIRGRGNTSWTLSDKKPYRLKFSKKISLCGLTKAKNYVLLAGWTDGSQMQNAIAAKIGHMVDMPYICDMIPVEVVLNGIYRGSYLLANKPGINAGNVDIDEETSIMWELDVAMDEDFTFYSPIYNLPVMVADPDMDEARFLEWKEDFIQMEQGVAEERADEWIDLEQYAAYRAVYDIMQNHELGHPKSLKLYKTEGGKYKFGPIWDFDVAMGANFGYDLDCYNLNNVNNKVSLIPFMQNIDKAPSADKLIRDAIVKFMENEDELWSFIDETQSQMESAAVRNTQRWPDRGDWHEQMDLMKTWLSARISYLKKLYQIKP
jgi:hypothetical protein